MQLPSFCVALGSKFSACGSVQPDCPSIFIGMKKQTNANRLTNLGTIGMTVVQIMALKVRPICNFRAQTNKVVGFQGCQEGFDALFNHHAAREFSSH
jgi:hypothetical protein